MSPTSILPTWLSAAIESLAVGDANGWASMYAPDAVHEFPFAPEGRPRRLEGREAIGVYIGEILAGLRFGSFSNIRIREAGDEVIVEADGRHQRIADDAQVELSYVWFITRREGRVTHFRDYMSPLFTDPLRGRN